MNAIETHREALRWSHELLELVISDVEQEQAHWVPPGTANPISAVYAHAICSMDSISAILLQGKPGALFDGAWAGRTGISRPQWGIEGEWARSLKVDLVAARQYAGAVLADLDAYLAGLPDSGLDRTIDLTAQGLGVRTVGWCLSALITGHNHNMAGEISVLKGLQGGRGYPF